MSLRNNNYSPFNNYFGLADVITAISLHTIKSALNPFATPFIPSVITSDTESDSDEQSPLSNSIQYKQSLQRQTAVLRKDQYAKVRFRIFCQKSNRSISIQKSHRLRDVNGNVECLYLRETVCPQCGSTGDDAHTIKYCPINQPTVFFT